MLINVCLIPVTGVLATHQIIGLQRTHCLKNLRFFAVYRPIAPIGRRFHRKQCDDLKQMILHYIAQTTGIFIKFAALAHTKIFGQGDLHTGYIVAIPDRFKK